MIDFANLATEFWSTNTRSSLEAAANFKREKVFANNAVTKVSAAVDALNQEIKKRYPSNPAELNAHIDAIDLARSAVVEAAAGLRRAIRETQVLEPGFSAELLLLRWRS